MNYLSSAPDAELIKNIKFNNDYASDSINAISERHGAIVTEVIKKFSSVLANTGIAPIDVYHEKDLLIYNSAMSYDDTKGAKFTSWLYNQTRYLCLNTINKESKKNKFTDDKKFDYLSNQTQKDFITEENQLQYIIKEINNISDCNERKIMELRYLDKDKNNNWKDIAKAVSLSVPTVLKIHKKHINSIKNRFNAEHEL